MNIYDISKQAGVSIATVSRVMNGSSNVSDKTREKVISTMKVNGFTPNVFARGLGLNSMHTIGILCADSSDSYLACAVYYLERELRKNGYDSLLCCTGYELETKEKYLKLLLSKRVDAVILAGSTFIESSKKKNQYLLDAAKEVPLMIINGYLEGDNLYSTLCDDYQSIYDLTSQFLNKKTEKLLYLYRSLSYSGHRKLAGFTDAFRDHNHPLAQDRTFCCNGSIEDAKAALIHLREQGMEFHAVLTSDDELAIGALKYAKLFNLRVPEDLSIVGYNNSILARCCEPELTSIDNKVETLCIQGVNTLMRAFSGSNVSDKITISAETIFRETTLL